MPEDGAPSEHTTLPNCLDYIDKGEVVSNQWAQTPSAYQSGERRWRIRGDLYNELAFRCRTEQRYIGRLERRGPSASGSLYGPRPDLCHICAASVFHNKGIECHSHLIG
jgi:hypothetical protein